MNKRLEAKKALEDAIQAYVDVMTDDNGTVRTEYVLNVAAVNMHMPSVPPATFYFRESYGSAHAIAGLAFMESESLKADNREQAEQDVE